MVVLGVIGVVLGGLEVVPGGPIVSVVDSGSKSRFSRIF